jgi:O-antigen ligase
LGPQSDRLILGKETGLQSWQILDNNSSNVIIYSYLSAGIVGLVLILLIYFKITTKILKQNINLKKLNKKNFYFNTAIAGILFLLTRGLFENGISLFNLDSCFFVIFYFLIKKRYFNHSTSLS